MSEPKFEGVLKGAHFKEEVERWLAVLKEHAAEMYETLSLAREAMKDLADPNASPSLILCALLDEQIDFLDRMEKELSAK